MEEMPLGFLSSKHGPDGLKPCHLLILISSGELLAFQGKYRSAPSSKGAVLPMLLLLAAPNKEIVKGPDAAKRERVGPYRDVKAGIFASSEPGDLYPRSEEPQMSATPCAARYRTGIVHVTSKDAWGLYAIQVAFSARFTTQPQ